MPSLGTAQPFLQDVPSRLEGRTTTKLAPPATSLVDRLPLNALSWSDLERLSLRLARRCGDVEECRLYGNPGDRQYGIDLYARLPEQRGWRVYQCKHVKSITPAGLKRLVDVFLAGKFLPETKEFFLCTNRSLRAGKLDDAWRLQAKRLRARGIKAFRWDEEELLSLLRPEPQLVFDFFGPAWFEQFYGRPPDEFPRRLPPEQVGEFTRRLRVFYGNRTDRLDPGLPLGYREESVRLPLADRFVSPDVLVRMSSVSASSARERQRDDEIGGSPANPRLALDVERPARFSESTQPPAQTVTRQAASAWIGRASRQVLLGNPGIGKSTILRFLASDLLGDEPRWRDVARNWGESLPVWVPFPFWTAQMSVSRGASMTLPELLHAWFVQEHQESLWPLVQAALEDDRLLLLVDGLDEYHDSAAARIVLHQLLSFLDAHPTVPALLMSRPLGFAAFKGTLGAWPIAEVAPLSLTQQDQFARVWFRADAARHDHLEGEADDWVSRRVGDFRRQLDSSRELGELAEVPLLLGSMVRLAMEGVHLPASRWEACEKLATLLLEDHPRRRREAARLPDSAIDSTAHQVRLDLRDKRRVFADLALRTLENRPTGIIEASLVVQWMAEFLYDDDQNICLDREKAFTVAREFLKEAQDELGLLVATAPGRIGFFHRLLQEWLASERLNEMPVRRQLEMVDGRAADPQWREVLLGLFQNFSVEVLERVVSLLESKRTTVPPHERIEIDVLLTAIAFGGVQTKGSERRRLMDRSFELILQSEDSDARERLLNIALSALERGSQLPRATMHAKIKDWFPGQLTKRQYVMEAMGEWLLDPPAINALFANLRSEDAENVRAAADALGKITRDACAVTERLLPIAGRDVNPAARAGAMEALRIGLGIQDARLLEIARSNRDCGALETEVVAIRILAAAGEQTDADRKRLLRAARWPSYGPRLEFAWRYDLVRAFVAGWKGDPVVRTAAIRSLQSEHTEPDRMEQEAAFFVLLAGYGHDERAASVLMAQFRDKRFALYSALYHNSGLFTETAPEWRGHAGLAGVVEEWIEAHRTKRGYGLLELFQLAKTESMKARLLERVHDDTTFHGLELQALLSVWGLEDQDVRRAARHHVNHSPQGYAHAQGHIRALADDPAVARAKLLAELRPDSGMRIAQILHSLRILDNNLGATDIVDRCLRIREADPATWQESVAFHLVAYGYPDPRVRRLAQDAFDDREGNLYAVALGWHRDPELRAHVLRCTVGLPGHLRELLVDALEHLGLNDAAADSLLSKYDLDAEIGVRCAAAAAGARRLVRSRTFGEAAVADLTAKLYADGPDKPEHRLAGIAGLIAAECFEPIQRFVDSSPYQHDLVTGLWFTTQCQSLVRLLVQKWEGLSAALGTEGLRRFFKILDPHDGLLRQLDAATAPGSSLARWLYAERDVADGLRAGHLDRLRSLAVAYPKSFRLRQSCIAALRSEKPCGPSRLEVEEEIAALVLAEEFGGDEGVHEELLADRPTETLGNATLISLVHGWPESVALREWHRYADAKKLPIIHEVFWACACVIAPPDFWARNLDRPAAPRVPGSAEALRDQRRALVARIRRDLAVEAALVARLQTTVHPSARITILNLLVGAGSKSSELRQWLSNQWQAGPGASVLPTRFGLDNSTGELQNEATAITLATKSLCAG